MLVADVIKATAAVSGYSQEILVGPSAIREHSRPRQVGIYLSHRMLRVTKTKIGKVWGGRDHSTVGHSIERVEQLLSAGDREIAALVAGIAVRLGETSGSPDALAIAAAREQLKARIETTERDLARLKAALSGLDALIIPGAVQ